MIARTVGAGNQFVSLSGPGDCAPTHSVRDPSPVRMRFLFLLPSGQSRINIEAGPLMRRTACLLDRSGCTPAQRHLPVAWRYDIASHAVAHRTSGSIRGCGMNAKSQLFLKLQKICLALCERGQSTSADPKFARGPYDL